MAFQSKISSEITESFNRKKNNTKLPRVVLLAPIKESSIVKVSFISILITCNYLEKLKV